MASMRDIKQRIKSVGSTQQITKAMNLVAASKLQRSRQRLEETQPFSNEVKRAIANIVFGSKGVKQRFLERREVRNTLYIVLAGDRGLCGGYNTNVCKAAHSSMKGKENVSVVAVGSKARDYFRRRNITLLKKFTGISERPFYTDAVEISGMVTDLFTKKEFDEIYIVYTEFISTLRSEPTVMRLLPVDTDKFVKHEEKGDTLMIYEPNEEEVLEYVIPKYINTVIYAALVEASVCELGSRMTSMDSATKNAGEMIDDLSLVYNRARQGAITQEINEIVSGANALS